jgi:biopolymer transport protein ExbB/TolQ
MKIDKGTLEISTAIDEELMRVSPLLEKRIPSLWSLANIATLIGLLGTIYGLIRAFSALAAVSPEQKAAFLARGISEAMNNTAVGLGIAILCMIGHLILSGRSKKMISDLDISAVTFENFLLLHNKKQDK